MGILAAIIALGVLIVVHEFGHFIVAKRSGVGVLKFSVGFGPRLFGRTVHGTEYVLSAIPLGGYVKMVGEDPDAVEEVDPRISFSHQGVWKRVAIVLAGPVFNILFAFVAISLVALIYGRQTGSDLPRVAGINPQAPAAHAGLQVDDLVTAVDDKPIATWDELSTAIRSSGGQPVVMTVRRGGDAVTVTVTPEAIPDKNLFGEVVGQAYVIGVERGVDRVHMGLLGAIAHGASYTLQMMQITLMSLVKMLQGRISSGDIGGPILIVQVAAQQASAGFEYLLSFMAVISVNLAVINLLPIPILDGGHLLFFLVEGVMRRPLEVRQREIMQQVGLVILLGVMAFAFYNDILRNIRGWG